MTDTRIEKQLEHSLREIGILPRPAILEQIRLEMHKEEPDFNHLEHLISADVALSASLIKITNSPFFGFNGHVNSPRAALMVLGLNVASKAIAGIVMRQIFPKLPHVERFWDASAQIAKLSGWIAQRLTSLPADDAYTFGLFRDCGIPILLTHTPDYFEILNRANNETGRSFTAVEDEFLPTNHSIIGNMLAQSWWLSDEICVAIRYHHDINVLLTPSIPPSLNTRHMIAVAQLAEHLLQQHSGLSHTQEWLKLGSACLNLLNLTEEDLAELLEKAIPIIDAKD